MNENWLREKARREALDALADLIPGDKKAKPVLDTLDAFSKLDRESPISDCALDLQQLEDLPSKPHPTGYLIIRDDTIPEPWKSRFAVALGKSGRVAEGFYRHDWSDFLDGWKQDLQRVDLHRQALDDDL